MNHDNLIEMIDVLIESVRNQKEENRTERRVDSLFLNQVKELLDSKKEALSNPETFETTVQHPIESHIQAMLRERFQEVSEQQAQDLTFLYTHYSFFVKTISELIQKVQGYHDVDKKAKWIIRSYQDFLVNETQPDLSEMYVDLTLFGTPTKWFDLCKSLHKLYDGKPDDYIQHMLKLTSNS